MKWNYDDSTRDLFSQGPHRDILIVPHATYVTPVPGGPPEIKSKVPQYMWIPMPVPIWDAKEKKMTIVTIQQPFPKKDPSTGEVLREDVEWVITNDDIIKEKFKYSHTLNSESNLTFSSCNAAMVQFTIRNKKQYVQELDDQGEPTGEYYWEQEVPNLQNYEFVEKDPDGNERKIVGELSGNACIKVYTYINGDSSTLMYLGMFQVEEDKMVDNGYNRQITAYDFMAYFRDCDIFYWYKHLWTGINKLDNDFEDYTSDSDEEKKKPDDYDAEVNWVRKPAKDLYPDRDGRWTIGEALKDLFNNFAAYDMITYDEEEVEVEDPDTHEKKKVKTTVAKLGNTVTNPNNYGRNYEEGTGYTGLGMPVILDSDLFNKDKSYNIPTEPGNEVYECYGYMDALDIEFYQDPNIMKSESLSMGKFLEDIGLLAGRYPYIRTDHLQDDDWFDPANCTGYQNRYNNYEKCILTFKPLPTAQDDSNLPTYQMLDNTEISKGFSHESYTVDDIEIVKINFQDKTNIQYSRLTASQRKDKLTGNVQTFTFSDNIFVSYLVDKSDNEEIKKKLENYKALKLKIFGKENKKGNMSSKALFAQGYYNMKYRSYVPYELTTFADPVRDVGDRIKITYTDVITGEHVSFFSYILEREMNGIQKCLDTYKAQGDGLNPVFSNYQSGSKYQSGSSYAASSFGYNAVYSGTGAGGSSGSGALGITPSDLVQYWRNFGIRLLDEPSDCQVKFVKGSENSLDLSKNHIYVTSSYPQETYIKDGDTTNKLTIDGQEIDIIEGDYVSVKNYQHDDPVIPNIWPWDESDFVPLYVYTANHKWEYAGTTVYYYASQSKNVYDMSASENPEVFLDHEDNYPVVIVNGSDEILGSTNNKLVIRPKNGENDFPYTTYNNTFTWYGGYVSETTISETITREAVFGDYADILALIKDDEQDPGTQYFLEYRYQYPGFWTHAYDYPDLTQTIEQNTKKYVSLKWSDPQDITDWKPTPATWEGTVIVRKENSAPLHRWDGEKVVRTTTRDKYKTKAYKDEDIKANKVYYYGFFPYYTKISDPEHPIRFYTFTKSIRVETGVITYAPVIESITVNGNDATITYSIVAPEGVTYSSIKLYGKIGSDPACDDTDDIVEDLDRNETSIIISDLNYETVYYFTIQCIDNDDAAASSNVESCILHDPVPPELKPYISKINDIATWKFAWANIPEYYYARLTLQYQYPATNYSYSCDVYSETNVRVLRYGNYDGNRINSMRTYNILTLNVTKNSAASYTGRIDFPAGSTASIHNIYNPKNHNASWVSIGVSSPESGSVNFWNFGNTGDGDTTVNYVTYTGTLEQVFSWYSDRFRNIDIYVDGVQYAKSHYNN